MLQDSCKKLIFGQHCKILQEISSPRIFSYPGILRTRVLQAPRLSAAEVKVVKNCDSQTKQTKKTVETNSKEVKIPRSRFETLKT